MFKEIFPFCLMPLDFAEAKKIHVARISQCLCTAKSSIEFNGISQRRIVASNGVFQWMSNGITNGINKP